ncbi:hypothetical protein DL766_006456 [Monosporascus sp. MC13-8B]|nr:hypothetical protein DL763_007522 [Monosporascus cannonballus]RYP27244.1 hypothetical protein DL766_006456 [Monosporascus sp. MC13-8B]
MSQYISTLNEVPQDVSPEESNTTLEEELAMFTNTNFIDWDTHNNSTTTTTAAAAAAAAAASNPQSSVNLDLDRQPATTASPSAPAPDTPGSDPLAGGELAAFDFNNIGEYGFDFNPYVHSSVQPYSDSIGGLQPIQPPPTFPRSASQQRPYGAPTPQTGEKRKAATEIPPPRQMSFEEQTRLAAEEDKRRRNTAASARFRIKKKAREQALEKSQKELGEKVVTLESRIQTLETENKWLRELVMEKNGGNEKVVTALLQSRKEKDKLGTEAKSQEKSTEAS